MNEILYIGAIASILELFFWLTAGIILYKKTRPKTPIWVKYAEDYLYDAPKTHYTNWQKDWNEEESE